MSNSRGLEEQKFLINFLRPATRMVCFRLDSLETWLNFSSWLDGRENEHEHAWCTKYQPQPTRLSIMKSIKRKSQHWVSKAVRRSDFWCFEMRGYTFPWKSPPETSLGNELENSFWSPLCLANTELVLASHKQKTAEHLRLSSSMTAKTEPLKDFWAVTCDGYWGQKE